MVGFIGYAGIQISQKIFNLNFITAPLEFDITITNFVLLTIVIINILLNRKIKRIENGEVK